MNMTMRTLLAATVLAIVSAATGPAWARDVRTEKCPERVLKQAPEDAGDDLLIDVDCKVTAGTYTWRNVRIVNGKTLTFEETQNGVINFSAASISIEDGGKLVAGTADLPFGSNGGQLNLIFTGIPPEKREPPEKCEMLDSHTDWCGKGIIVRPGTTLYLFGAKGATAQGVSWTHLSDAAGPAVAGAKVQGTGATTLKLARDVTQGTGAWKPNDWITVATTSFSPFETEFVQIDTVTAEGGGSSVTLKAAQALKHYHFGGPDPGPPSAENYNGAKSTAAFNYGVDERAEVGLISRSIKFSAVVDAANPHWGGEIKILKGFAQAVLQGVELGNFGKNRLGAYPIHLHQLGPVADGTLTINANSVHHSFNKCVTLHSSQNVTVQNMVCARIIGHIFYQEIGDESGIKYLNNLGLGAMSTGFDVPANLRGQFWAGDNLAATIGYDGFKVPNTDDQQNPTRGVCACRGVIEPARVQCADRPSPTGELAILGNHTPYSDPHPGACASADVYFEPASGFWIVNPGTVLEGNSIGGCQGVGRGYWYVPPRNVNSVPVDLRTLQNVPLGSFKNNRVHGCFSGLYAEEEYGVFSEQLFPKTDSQPGGKNLISTFDGFTATRIRDRGVWIRPMWSVLKHGRFATNKASVILVSSGGLDGNAPGVWALLQDSVLIGMSQNNVERWGPCPVNSAKGVGCVDLTPVANDIIGDGYPLPAFNLLGYQIYDGPVRIFNDRFVNFNRDITPHLTDADKTFLSGYTQYFQGFPATPKKRYEGDAALGWFKANQSAYPNATVSKGLIFENVDIRHQIFTQFVNYGDFQDGDRNTVILDEDGSLTGFEVVSSAGERVRGAHPVSLNNLGFNQAGNSVDECLAEGQQDSDIEARPTSLISPYGVATLEFQGNFPPSQAPPPGPNPAAPATKQRLTFSKDYKDFCPGPLCDHQKMELTSRDGRAVWEPKVVSGGGYTVAASPCANPPACTTGQAGIPARVSVGLTDAVKPVISAQDPFAVRIGICYTDTGGQHPAGNFTITRGYHSWGGNGTETSDPDLQQFFNLLTNRYPKDATETCINLDVQTCVVEGNSTVCRNLDPVRGCPAHGVTAVPASGGCPAPSVDGTDAFDRPACIFPKEELTKLDCADSAKTCVAKLTPADKKYYYDQARGMLFFWVVQDAPNAVGPSPLGACAGGAKDPSCPDLAGGESYYACPAQGCIDYVVRLNDASYNPGPSKCTPYPDFEMPEPPATFHLVLAKTNTAVQRSAPFCGNAACVQNGSFSSFPHYETNPRQICSTSSTP